MNERNVKFRYIRKDGHPVGVVCVDTISKSVGWSYVSNGLSLRGNRVNKPDQFDRTVGRNIAFGRMCYGTVAHVPNELVQTAIDEAHAWLNRVPTNA